MKTKFAFEVPIPDLKFFEPYQDFHLTLPQLWKHDEYKHYMLHKTKLPIWLDNGVNELGTPMRWSELANIALKIRGDLRKAYGVAAKLEMVVTPDHWEWDWVTLWDSYKPFRAYFYDKHLMLAINKPHHLKWAERMGVINLAIPKEVRPMTFPFAIFPEIHFFALLAPEELPYLRPKSVDTGMPIKLAKHGWTWEDWRKKGADHLDFDPDFFDIPLGGSEKDLAVKNIKELKRYAEMYEV